jgi:integrase
MSRRTFGSARRLSSGRWQASYWYEGQRRVGPVTFDTKAAACGWLSSVETSMLNGTWVDPEAGGVSFARWCDWYLENSTHKRATTLARDRHVVDAHLAPAFGGKPLRSITPIDIRMLVSSWTKTLAPATVRTDYAVLRAILNAAVEADLIRRSPCRGIRMPPPKRREIRFVSPIELERLADAVPLEYRPMVYVAGVLGLRWSEVAGLRVGRIDLSARTLSVVETLAEVEGQVAFAEVKSPASRRTISMPRFLTSMLAKHLLRRGRPGPEELTFVSPNGGPLHAGNFRTRIWAPAVEQAGLEGLTFHGLRHSAAGLLISLGAPDHLLQQRMGHSSSRVTRDVYGHVLPTVDEAVVSDIDEVFGNPSRTDRARRPGTTRGPNRRNRWDQELWSVEVSGLEPPTSTLRT